ncbi:WXG100 family type VII secretion target [Nocardia crassostreae]|uniref:WXG100 family type VII secretion target n=1 Tax=Nocardia crassostreae TaxID=53428 RepID=UPI00082D36B3|nr:WXG100 family type VII secretion target [Nocardia crassostreae]
MAASSGGQIISAQFASVADNATAIINRAEQIRNDLEAFHKSVEDFVANNWKGDANEAFADLQRTWNTHVGQLNTTLGGAATLVRTGNAELQAKDTALAGLF